MKNLRLLRIVMFASISVTGMPAAAFAQDKPAEAVIVPGSRGAPACSLQLLNSVPLEINNDQLTVSAGINGKMRTFQFDTAAVANQMTDSAARSLGLSPSSRNDHPAQVTGSLAAATTLLGGIAGTQTMAGPPRQYFYDSKGVPYTQAVTIANFTLGAMQTKSVDFYITPFPPSGVDGVFNIDLFRRFDIDLNFAARSFNTFSQDHCKGQILYWRVPGVTALPFLTRDNRIVTHVMLEGKELTAVIDTGSPISALRFNSATRLFGISPGDAGVTLVGEHHGDALQDRYTFNFKTLSFGKVAIGNPRIILTREMLARGSNPNARTGSRVLNDADDAEPDMIIGMDLLKLTHLYIALGERVLYVTQGPELAPNAAGAEPVVPVTPFRP